MRAAIKREPSAFAVKDGAFGSEGRGALPGRRCPSFVTAVTRQRLGERNESSCPLPRPAPLPFFLYPFRVENLYLLWECNLFLMDNVTLSGAGSWVS